MSNLSFVPYEWSERVDGYVAICPDCKDLVSFIGHEAVVLNQLTIPLTAIHHCTHLRRH